MKRENTVPQCITKRPILDFCKMKMRRSGAWVARRWRDQEGLDLADTRATSTSTEEEDGGGESEGEEEER